MISQSLASPTPFVFFIVSLLTTLMAVELFTHPVAVNSFHCFKVFEKIVFLFFFRWFFLYTKKHLYVSPAFSTLQCTSISIDGFMYAYFLLYLYYLLVHQLYIKMFLDFHHDCPLNFSYGDEGSISLFLFVVLHAALQVYLCLFFLFFFF